MIILLILLHVKHFLADFPLQTPYMLGKGKSGTDWILPLIAHCLVHASLSALIIGIYRPEMIWIVSIEFLAHFIIDRLKVLYKLPVGQWPAEVRGQYLAKYYTAFGIDQLAHQLTYVLMVYLII